jgi:probable rRNA maturation factor
LPDHLTDLQFVLIDRATMARVHGSFLGAPAETDVITFPYGEILICPAVACAQAPDHGLDLEQEVLLYALHGLLHLAGYDDTTPAAAKQMARVQARLLKQVLEIRLKA